MLSPTLPAAIENELSRSSEKENSSAPSSAEKPRKHINEPNNKTSPTVLKLNKTLSDPEETRHHSDLSKLKELAKVEEKTHHPDQPPKKPKLVVRLKYGRKHRKEVERYLRLPSNKPRAPPVKPRREEDVKPEKPRSSEVRRVDSALEEERNAKRNLVKETPSDHVEKKATPVVRRDKEEVLKSSSEKRKRHDDEKHEQQPVKRQKGPPTLDLDKQPSTPVQPAGPSPTVASNRSSTQKTHLSATPRKDLKAVHMVRSTSTDSNTRTPQASGGTPMNLKVTSAPNGRSSEVELWLSLSRKYNDLGRKLKYQWQEIGKKKETTEQERKHAAVLAVESLLWVAFTPFHRPILTSPSSYVLAYHCADTSARLNHRPCSLDQSWLTLIPLWKTYLRASAAYPPLEGLIYHLGVVIRSAIATILTERINLARASDEKSKDGNAPPPSRTGSHDAPTPTPSASGAQPSYPSHALVGENWTELNRCVRDASMKLSVDMLIRLFPNTWAIKVPEASKPPLGMLDRDADALITGKFWLPISTDTSPGQGVRAGLRLLEEWMDNEKVHDMELIMKKA